MSITQFYNKPFKLKAKKSKNTTSQQMCVSRKEAKFIHDYNKLLLTKDKLAYKIMGYTKEPMISQDF